MVASKTLHLSNFPMQDIWQCLKTTDNYVANIPTLALVINAKNSALIGCNSGLLQQNLKVVKNARMSFGPWHNLEHERRY